MSELPFVAIGADELGEPLGPTLTCEECGAEHEVISQPSTNGGLSLQFMRCGTASYLIGINGQAIQRAAE